MLTFLVNFRGSVNPVSNISLEHTHTHINLIMSATVEFSREVMLGMLRKGQNGNEIMDILNVIAPESDGDSVVSDYGQGNGYDPIDF